MMVNDSSSLRAAGNTAAEHGILESFFNKLASGSRVNSSTDDVAGNAAAGILRADIVGLRQSGRNVSDGVSMLQTAEGAAGVISDNLVRMKALAAGAASGGYSTDQKQIMQREFDQLAAENARIMEQLSFNDIALFADGGVIEISPGSDDAITFATEAPAVGDFDLISEASDAMEEIEAAINRTSDYRNSIGSAMNRLSAAAEALDSRIENLLASESSIADIDVATETAATASSRIRMEAAVALHIHAGAIPRAIQMLAT